MKRKETKVHDWIKDPRELLVSVRGRHYHTCSEAIPAIPVAGEDGGVRLTTHDYDRWREWDWGEPLEGPEPTRVAGRILRMDDEAMLVVSGADFYLLPFVNTALLDKGPEARVPAQLQEKGDDE
jgi:hypothetical protein